ncbi:hypothetical protein DHEL01_v200833 [Diaporthe helianthi]|uniref:Uncharacterized protein n=1 Tax=Diaporthe helianthi TaxID=158607 RepID=A0A2P5IE58_DIAHE|nr:hypothetical protein DHEL01_v200833 [Diaporthe helianthi]
MVTTRSLSNRSQPGLNNRPTITGRVEKPRTTPKNNSNITPRRNPKRSARKTIKIKVKGEMSAEECEAETMLMRQISLGEIIFSNRFDPPWEEPKRASLLGLPSQLRDEIINLVFPVLKQGQQQRRQEAGPPASADDDAWENFRGRVFKCNYIHPILWTCRQLRYEYGRLFLTNNHFIWSIPRDWDPTAITQFTQHAASVGVPDFPLTMDMETRVDGPGYKCYPHAPLDDEQRCRGNLDRWMKEVYYGVETRVLVNGYPLRRDDGLIAHFLHQAQQYREKGKSWEQLQADLCEAWEAFLERRSLAEVNVGKDVGTMTGLYKASNARLERARALSLGGGRVY